MKNQPLLQRRGSWAWDSVALWFAVDWASGAALSPTDPLSDFGPTPSLSWAVTPSPLQCVCACLGVKLGTLVYNLETLMKTSSSPENTYDNKPKRAKLRCPETAMDPRQEPYIGVLLRDLQTLSLRFFRTNLGEANHEVPTQDWGRHVPGEFQVPGCPGTSHIPTHHCSLPRACAQSWTVDKRAGREEGLRFRECDPSDDERVKTRWKGAQTLLRKLDLLMCSFGYTASGQQRAEESNTAALLQACRGRHWSHGWRWTGSSSHPFTGFLNLLFTLRVV